ncbi:MAG TPA: GDSL-type esterase/lipase family protein [Thermoanaerobaculia bacterium]|nr:GDSL-type esterase/lipase family protein [Thermoanaerobaculia bacterium]
MSCSRTLAIVGLAAALALPAAAQTTRPTRYIAFGDSITEGAGDDPSRAPLTGYPPRLEALLVNAGINADVINQGLGGEATPEALSRLTGALAGTQDDDVLLLMEGTNDISRGVPLEATRYNLNEMARRAEARGLTVIHATPLPRRPDARVDSNNILTLILAQNVRDMAGRRGRDLVDIFEIFITRPNRFPALYYTTTGDGVGHPNAAGYDLIAQSFFEVITDVDRVSPVTGIMSPLPGAERVPAATSIQMDVWDFGAGIDVANTQMLVNGTPVAATVSGDQNRVQLAYQPPELLRGVVRVGLRSRDLALPTQNTVDREIARFVINGTKFLKGDLNEDGRVDGADLVRLAVLFGARRGDNRFLPSVDLNRDDAIDGQDLAILAADFGKTSF